jgi:hypothetical protein
MSRSYTSSPPCASIGVLWDCFTFSSALFKCRIRDEAPNLAMLLGQSYGTPHGAEIDEYGAMVGREKPVPVPLCLPQIPHVLTRERTWASILRGQRLRA